MKNDLLLIAIAALEAKGDKLAAKLLRGLLNG